MAAAVVVRNVMVFVFVTYEYRTLAFYVLFRSFHLCVSYVKDFFFLSRESVEGVFFIIIIFFFFKCLFYMPISLRFSRALNSCRLKFALYTCTQ